MPMIYRLLADFVIILHFCFILFAVFGGLLVLRRRWVMWLHIPALIWGIVVQSLRLICPLTLLENWFRDLGSETGYSGGFIDHYVSMILYFDINSWFYWLLALISIGVNLFVYSNMFLHWRMRCQDTI